jgi:predicted  nucleic acid-binding Zn-ribbon protein
MNASANARISDLKEKLEAEKRTFEDSQRDYTSKYSWLARERDSLATEAEELKWELEKRITNSQELSHQLRAQHEEIFKLNEELLERS